MILCPQAHYSLVALSFFFFSVQEYWKYSRFLFFFEKDSPVKEIEDILSYFPVELLKTYVEKRHDAYKTQILPVPRNEKS